MVGELVGELLLMLLCWIEDSGWGEIHRIGINWNTGVGVSVMSFSVLQLNNDKKVHYLYNSAHTITIYPP